MPTVPACKDQPWLKSHFPSGLLYPDCIWRARVPLGVPANTAGSWLLICH